jgi:hypothetical protein
LKKSSISINVSYSYQNKSIRLQLILKQCLEIKGELVFRPGGGALIENLNNLNADIVLSKI